MESNILFELNYCVEMCLSRCSRTNYIEIKYAEAHVMYPVNYTSCTKLHPRRFIAFLPK